MKTTISLGPLFVKQYPCGYGYKKREDPWKEAVANECKKYWGDRTPIKGPVNLRLKFYLNKNKDLDLTGMLESTVNAISSIIFPPSSKGGHKTRWNHEDRWVYTIEASKGFRDTDHGVEIIIEG